MRDVCIRKRKLHGDDEKVKGSEVRSDSSKSAIIDGRQFLPAMIVAAASDLAACPHGHYFCNDFEQHILEFSVVQVLALC